LFEERIKLAGQTNFFLKYSKFPKFGKKNFDSSLGTEPTCTKADNMDPFVKTQKPVPFGKFLKTFRKSNCAAQRTETEMQTTQTCTISTPTFVLIVAVLALSAAESNRVRM
jgi:hypothetical protein